MILSPSLTSLCIHKLIRKQTVLLSAGDPVSVVPIVKDGLIKVFTRYEDRELFLYHIQPIMGPDSRLTIEIPEFLGTDDDETVCGELTWISPSE